MAVTLKIYNLIGQQVRTLIDRQHEPGNFSIMWNARDDNGNVVPSGVYVYQLKSDGFIKTKKMILLQ
jgi:flagellar hook assembly protein FlgD